MQYLRGHQAYAAAAAIRAINPAIFEGLHDNIGFDFESPVTIQKLSAPFTINKAWKEIGTAHKPSDSTAAIIMRTNDGGYMRTPVLVPITADDLRSDYDKMSYHKYDHDRRYTWILDDFNRKCSFNDMRKRDNCEAYIIAQYNQFISKPTEPTRDWTERQRDMAPGEHEQRSRIYYSNRPRPAIIIDKSNYRVDLKRDDLKHRAAQLRAEREKAAADDATRATAARRFNDLLTAFSAAKHRIIDALVNVDLLTGPAAVTEMETIGKAIGEYAWGGLSGAARDINQFADAARDNKFTSPARYDAAYNEILKKLAAILPEDASTAKETV